MATTARPRRPRGLRALSAAASDLRYEWDMTKVAAVLLSSATEADNPLLVNVALECLLLHARNIRDFFAPRGQSDDVLAADFLGRPLRVAMPLLRSHSLRTRLNRRIAHLSYSRARLKRGWQVRTLTAEIDRAMTTFVRRLRASQPRVAKSTFGAA